LHNRWRGVWSGTMPGCDSGGADGCEGRPTATQSRLPYPITSMQQFAERFSNDLAAIREAGFEITTRGLRSRGRTYDIRRAAPTA
jgi:hypothetical protein